MNRTIALGSAAAIVTLLVAGVLATTLMAPSDPFDDCGGGQVAGSIGGPFELLNNTGQTVTDAQVITEPTLIYFGFTFCPDVCPLDNARNAAAVDILAAQGISATPVFISIDPDRDTPEIVGSYSENFHDKMIGLTGSPEQVAAASRAYKTFFSKNDDDPVNYTVNHSTFSYLAVPGLGVLDFYNRNDSPEVVAERAACFAKAAARLN